MIPLTLTLRNFLSYGSPAHTIDFKPYPLICLSGKNGHGKSALLDAITWVLWGQARKIAGSARADDALLRQGCDEMVVTLDFMSAQTTYRVRRSYTSAGNKQHMTLDMACITDDGMVTAVLTEKTIRSTQQAIERIIGIDYDGFISSAYIRQGNSQEFSKKSAKERKELLATLLGIDQYEVQRTRVLERMKTTAQTIDTLSGQIEMLTARMRNTITVEHGIATHEQALSTLRTEQEHMATQLVQAQRDAQQAAIINHTLAQYTRNLEQAYHERTQAVQRARSVWRTLRAHTTVAPAGPTLTELEQQLHQLLAQQTTYVRWAEHDRTLRTAHTMALDTLKTARAKITHLERQLADIPHLARAADIQTYYHKCQQVTQRLLARKQVLTHKKQQLDRTQPSPEPALGNTQHCPVCYQTVRADHAAHVTRWYDQQRRHIQHQLARIARVVPQLQDLLAHQQHTLSTISQGLKLQQELETVRQQCAHTQQQVHALEQDLIAHGQRASSDPHGELQKVQHLLSTATKQLQTASEHATLDTWKALAVTRNHLRNQVRTLLATVRQERATWLTVQDAPARLHTIQTTLTRIQTQIHEHESELKLLRKEQEDIRTAQETRDRLTVERAQAEVDLHDYQFLAHAYSKEGIQALLIEQALPDIEREANAILSALTDNQTHIMFESIKDLKSGKLKETLDIHISDQLGIRPYELFSGGEAFRIDFALRIGLAQFVSQKAGARLQTLIIDEGFGSQDDDGLHVLIEAIQKIQSAFDKIIVVSHLPHLKEQLPVHFLVYKDIGGSQVSVISQA